MEKYLGNKSGLLPIIEAFIASRFPNADSISDLFTGTTNVGRYFSARGYATDVGDVNRFSYVLAKAYLSLREFPAFARSTNGNSAPERTDRLRLEFSRQFKRYGAIYQPDMSEPELWNGLKPTARALAHLQEAGEANRAPGPISRYFSRWGDRSAFHSLRGTHGHRNYFSKENALVLDGILAHVRALWSEGRVTRDEIFVLLTSVIEEVVITANVNGTFHDFNRDKLWPNALQKFLLRVPLASPARADVGISNDDALQASKYVPQHSVCYIDPPYNFRQYTSYYHLLNFIAAYPFLPCPEAYLADLDHVRGQNMQDDHSSVFCGKSSFIDSLRTLISQIDAPYVALSYYNGRNHWNHWASVEDPTTEGLTRLKDLFGDSSLFSSFEAVPAMSMRLNYQSRGGEQKLLVNEYLIMGVKSKTAPPRVKPSRSLDANERLGLADQFAHDRTHVKVSMERGRRRGAA